MSEVFWAAFGGGAAAGVFVLLAVVFAEWFRWFLDRPLIRVKVGWAYHLDASSREPEISVEAINPHSKPVTLSSHGFIIKGAKEQTLVITQPRPYQLLYELKGGKSISEWVSLDDLFAGLERANKEPTDMGRAWFRAESGKFYRSTKLHKNFILILQKEHLKRK